MRKWIKWACKILEEGFGNVEKKCLNNKYDLIKKNDWLFGQTFLVLFNWQWKDHCIFVHHLIVWNWAEFSHCNPKK